MKRKDKSTNPFEQFDAESAMTPQQMLERIDELEEKLAASNPLTVPYIPGQWIISTPSTGTNFYSPTWTTSNITYSTSVDLSAYVTGYASGYASTMKANQLRDEQLWKNSNS